MRRPVASAYNGLMQRGWSLTNLARRSPWPERLFLLLSAIYVLWHTAYTLITQMPQLPAQFPSAGWFSYLFLLPAVCSWLVLRKRRRYLAWPFIFLGLLLLAPLQPPPDQLAQAYQLGSMALLALLLALAEVAGLSLGRWIRHAVAMAYFLLAAGVLLGLALGGPLLPGRFPWQVHTLALAGGLYFVQALVELAQSDSTGAAAGDLNSSAPTGPSS